MIKFLKWTGIIIGSLLVVLFIAFKIMQSQTKKHSPEQTETLKVNDLELTVFYNQPSKKDREIFGGLVPYGEIWRTGANEPTTFTTNKAINFGGQEIRPGSYSMWTIPNPDSWTVILNSGEYGWGVSWGGVASRDPAFDVATAEVPVLKRDDVVEKLAIGFNEDPIQLFIMWDQTEINVDIN
jgi:hypothetical protein